MNKIETGIPKDAEEIKDENPSFIDEKALQMMKKMGYKPGVGLGKYEQGITRAINIDQKIDVGGLGFISKLDTKIEWDFSLEEVAVKENLEWLENVKTFDLSFAKLQSFLVVGDPKEIPSNSYDFCDTKIFDAINKAKDIFNKYNIEDLNKARARSNPFEKIHSVFFMNRAALKLANIDAATNFMFSDVDKDINHCESKGPFFFADVCAGPGGFSEYILWRRSWFFKGFGLTLRDENDFQLYNSCCISPHSFQTFYGTEGDGNVCCPDNVADFKNKVLFLTKGKGVHFMTSDGGFCVDGNENFQEILSKNIYLCQCLVALEIVRSHGHFVTKLFDVFTRFSVALIYLMYRCFKKVSILKPNSSRPANAERYLICSDLQNNEDVENIRRYLKFIAKKMWELKDKEQVEVLEIVPMKKIKNDVEFFNYIRNSNNTIGQSQIIALNKLAAFCQNPTLRELRQDELRIKCLEYWVIPDMTKKACKIDNETTNDFLVEFVLKTDWLKVPPIRIENEKSLKKIFENAEDWSYCTLYSSTKKNGCNFYAGLGSKTCKWQNGKWMKIKNLKLTKGTLLYGESIREVIQCDKIDEDSDPSFRYCLHIIDAIYLGNICLMNHTFRERMDLISIYAESINQEFQEKQIHIRKKPMFSVKDIPFSTILRKEDDKVSFSTILPSIGYNSIEESQDANSVLFVKHRKDQSLQSTFVLRAQLCLEEVEDIGLLNILMNDVEHTLGSTIDEQI